MTVPVDADRQRASRIISEWMPDVLAGLVAAERAVPAFEIAERSSSWSLMTIADLGKLSALLREFGYLHRAIHVAEVLQARTGGPAPVQLTHAAAQLTVLGGAEPPKVPALESPLATVPGRVLAVVGSSRLEAESAPTLRTDAIARAGASLGAEVRIATQMGIGGASAYDVVDDDGLKYHRIPGPARGVRPFDEWLALYVTRLAAVARKVRPVALLATSDFVNGVAALQVGDAYGIPVVYDVRGLFEDSWLKRLCDKVGLTEAELLSRWGTPDVWALRRQRELETMQRADVVVAASDSLRDRLSGLGISDEKMFVAGDPESFHEEWAGVFERVGVVDAGHRRLLQVEPARVDLAQIKSTVRRPLGMTERFGGAGSVASIRDSGWRLGKLPPVFITEQFDWINACTDHRSQGFHLHAWDFMVPFLDAWDRDGSRDALHWCLSRAADWANTFSSDDDHGTMAWYDMAIGLRAPRLAYLLQEAVHEQVESRVVEALVHSVVRHQRALFAPQAFNPSTNHGFYTAAGQLSFARRLESFPGMDVVLEQGAARMRTIVATQFGADGGHLEHSPDYHRMLLSSFRNAIADDLLTDPEVVSSVERADEVLGWFVRPDRSIVPIGDSPARAPRRQGWESASPHTAFLLHQGEQGEPNDQELLLLQQSGYGIVRSPQPVGQDDHINAGYLTLMAGFHSRTHKHCDDLSVTWFDGGQELLIDAGRFGYLDQLPADSPLREQGFFYGRPERQYVERTRAHNTVEADGRDHERRRRTPYGSAIESGEKQGAVFRLSGRVDHGAWSHRRSIAYLPGRYLHIEDELSSLDGQPHDFRVWWNFPESLHSPRVEDGRVIFTLESGRTLHVVALKEAELLPPLKGQQEPLRGWRSMVDYEFTPAWSMAHHVAQRVAHTFSTVLSLDGFRD